MRPPHRLAALFFVLLFPHIGAAAELIPLETFVREPVFDEIRLSPDGTRISALARWNGHLQIFVIDIKTKKPRQSTGYELVDVDSVRWRDNQTLSYTTVEDYRRTSC